MRIISLALLGLQTLSFIALTFFIFYVYDQMAKAGAGFDPRFVATQSWRLIAQLAPYLVLPISITSAFMLHRKKRYWSAISLSLLLITLTTIAGQFYLGKVPEPIQENFGARAQPYSGFLVLPPEAVPEGFVETEHRYSKREYTISFSRLTDGQKIDLDIVEGDNIAFGLSGSVPVQEFEYQGVTGKVYTHTHKDTGESTYNLIWLNPPKQRISIYLTQTKNHDYSPEDLIDVLKQMR